MSGRVFLIGLDGFDREVVERYRSSLPNLNRLLARGQLFPISSTFPPDSTTAWATIYTGEGPGVHGVVDFVDPLEKVVKLNTAEQSSASLPGNTFWDRASQAGKRVAIIFPHMGYPTWHVNGKMFGRSTVHDATDAHPPGCCDAETLQALNVLKRFPGRSRQARRFLQAAEDLVHREFAFAESVAAEEKWDLVFFYSSTVDLVEHFFWPIDTDNLSGPILNFYRLYDDLLGKLLRPYEESHTIVLVSDHGHGARPNRIVNVNEILRQMGLLTVLEGNAGMKSGIIKWVQKTALRTVGTLGLENLARSILKAVPGTRKVFTNPILFDPQKSTAYLSDFSGVKAYSYGGIRLNPSLGKVERAAATGQIIRVLADLRDPVTGASVFAWVRPREAVVAGKYAQKYPELLFMLRDSYGAGREVRVPIMALGESRQLVPGSHRIDTPLLLVVNPKRPLHRGVSSLEDVAPLIAELLEME